MSTPRALAMVVRPDGCALWRVFMPFAGLQRRGYPAEWLYSSDPLSGDLILGKLMRTLQPNNRMPAFDVALFPRLSWEPNHRELARRYTERLRMVGVSPIYEVDDDLFRPLIVSRLRRNGELDKSAEAQEVERQERIYAMGLCDGVTVSTPRLATIVRQYTDAPVEVVPNAIDLHWWRLVMGQAERTVPGPTIGWAGGRRPDVDVEQMAIAWGQVAQRHPDVTFVVMGHQPKVISDHVPEHRVARLPWLPVDEYPRGYVNIDIGCCPLAYESFNLAKTPIKAWEYAAAGAAVVASPVVYDKVIRHERTGYLATTWREWEHALEALLKRDGHRQAVASRLLREVEQNWSMDANWWRWPAAWDAILDHQPRAQRACPGLSTLAITSARG